MGEDLSASDLEVIPAAALQTILACSGAPVAVRPLRGGRGVNRTLCITTRAGRLVLKQRIGSEPRPGADAAREVACQRVGAAVGAAPAVFGAAPDASWILMECVAGAVWTARRLQAEEELRRLCVCLRRLHGAPPPEGVAPFDPMAIAAGQARAILARDPAARGPVDAALTRTRELAAACAGVKARPVTTHGDLHAGNLIGPGPMLVDFEYAQLADPVYDLACLCVYHPALAPRGGALLAMAGISDGDGALRLARYRELFGCLNRLWHRAQELRGAPQAGAGENAGDGP